MFKCRYSVTAYIRVTSNPNVEDVMMINCHRTHRSRPRHNHQQRISSVISSPFPFSFKISTGTTGMTSPSKQMITMVKRGRYFWKMIESPAPDTDLEIDSLDVLGENPSACRKCGESNEVTRPKVNVWTSYVLDLHIYSHIILLHSRSNLIQVTRKFLYAMNNVIITKHPRGTHCTKYVYKLWVLAQ